MNPKYLAFVTVLFFCLAMQDVRCANDLAIQVANEAGLEGEGVGICIVGGGVHVQDGQSTVEDHFGGIELSQFLGGDRV